MSPLKALDWLAPNQLENVRIVFSNNDSELAVNLLAFHTHLEESKLADMIRLPDKRKRSALLASCIDTDDREYTMERQIAESILNRFEIGDMENAVRLCEETGITVQADLRIQFTGRMNHPAWNTSSRLQKGTGRFLGLWRKHHAIPTNFSTGFMITVFPATAHTSRMPTTRCMAALIR